MVKKVCFYTDTPIFGGAERQMLTLAKFLKELGVEAYLVISNAPSLDEFAIEWGNLNLKVFRISAFGKHDPRHFFALRRICVREKFDLMHLHLWNPAACRYGFLVAGFLKLQCVVTEHDPFLLKGLKFWLKKLLLSFVDSVIAISDENFQLLESLHVDLKGKIHLVANGLDLILWQEKYERACKKREVLREKILINYSKKKIFLTVAALHERKGLDLLIRAVAEIKRKDAVFVIYGQGPMEEILINMVDEFGLSDEVKILTDGYEVSDLMVAADFFVLPSRREAFGLVVLEAMFCELLVLAAAVGGVKDLIIDGENGLLFRACLVDEIVGVIDRALNFDSETLNKVRIAAKSRACEKFSAHEMAKKTLEIYRRCLR
jgi:glycosyltransferase involved in cell wall biosynthesis